MSPEDRLEFGITDSLIRFCVAIENTEDVLAVMDQALDQTPG
ncbi:MAG: PLP-dependent transferase [Anaerolineae bacterium]|nr:PLP-dependent transferase [Anaerolineae bacterium]